MSLSVTPPFTLTEEERSLLPSDSDVEFYAEHGWYLTKKLFTDDEVDELVAASERFYAGERDRSAAAAAAEAGVLGAVQGRCAAAQRLRPLRARRPGAAAAQAADRRGRRRLARADEIRVFQSTLIYKPPIAAEPTNIVPWHFDRHYWSTSTSDRMLTAFIPFHDCGEEMGTITMIDGSHRWQEIGRDDSTTRHFAERESSDLERVLAENAAYNDAEVVKVPMIIPKGHMSFHHCRTYHGSVANRSARPRRAISFHLQDGDNATASSY